MAEFKTINTQDELDRIIGDRLRRAEETYKKNFEGYLSPTEVESANKLHQEALDDISGQLDAANKKVGDLEKTIAEKDSTIRAYELRSVKSRIAHDIGLPYEAIDYLKGETEEDLTQSAHTLKAMFGAGRRQPMANPDTYIKDARKAAIANMAAKLKGE